MKICIVTTIKILMAGLFILCLFDMPYYYFQLVRFFGMIGFIWLAYFENRNKDKSLIIVLICSAVLINPIFKIALGRIIWNIVDIIWAIGLSLTVIPDIQIWRNKKKYSNLIT